MERVEEFVLDGRTFFYFDLSGFETNDDFSKLIKATEELIAKHPQNSLYTITNIENVKFDTETKEIVAKWMEHNKPYVKYGTVIGVDGIKKIMVNMIFKQSGRSNMSFTSTKEQAIELLLKQK